MAATPARGPNGPAHAAGTRPTAGPEEFVFQRSLIVLLVVGQLTLPAHAALQQKAGDATTVLTAPSNSGTPASWAGMSNRVTQEVARERAKAPVALADALKAFALVTDGFNYGGTGDVQYWMKSAKDFGKSGAALGNALQHVVRNTHGSAATAVKALGAQLAGLDWGGNGDVNYWMLRTKEICQSVRRVGSDLRRIANSAGATNVSDGRVLYGFSRVCLSIDYSGTGVVEYWMKTTKDFAMIGRATGNGLDTLVTDSENPVNEVVRDIAHQLKSLNEGGHGDVYYWMGRARTMADRITSLGRSLETLSQGN
jgi:hypothetical protein